jgi:hypothetical protein
MKHSSIIVAFLLAPLSSVTLAGPIPAWQGGDYYMAISDNLWTDYTQPGQAASSGLHRLSLSFQWLGKDPSNNSCFVFMDKQVPSFVFCEKRANSSLGGAIWARKKGNNFECVAGCAKNVPSTLRHFMD